MCLFLPCDQEYLQQHSMTITTRITQNNQHKKARPFSHLPSTRASLHPEMRKKAKKPPPEKQGINKTLPRQATIVRKHSQNQYDQSRICLRHKNDATTSAHLPPPPPFQPAEKNVTQRRQHMHHDQPAKRPAGTIITDSPQERGRTRCSRNQSRLRLPARACARVPPSTSSSSPPNGTPWAIRLTCSPLPDSRWAI